MSQTQQAERWHGAGQASSPWAWGTATRPPSGDTAAGTTRNPESGNSATHTLHCMRTVGGKPQSGSPNLSSPRTEEPPGQEQDSPRS